MTDLETRLDRLMKDKRDRRAVIHYSPGGPPVCTSKATLAPHVTRRKEQVTCKRCLHLLAGPSPREESK